MLAHVTLSGWHRSSIFAEAGAEGGRGLRAMGLLRELGVGRGEASKKAIQINTD